jgi:membrane-bound lytic murein transglycosylase A
VRRSQPRIRAGIGAAILTLLVGCNAIPAGTGPVVPAAPPPTTPLPPAPTASALATAALAGVTAGAAIDALNVSPANARAALGAFRISCPAVQRRPDLSGLTEGDDWAAPCAAAAGWRDDNAAAFFAEYFTAVQVGDGKAFATGYFEPEILASRTRQPGYAVPVYRRPPDLVEVNLGTLVKDLAGRTVRGRVENGQLVRYADRAAIENGALAGRGLEIAYAADPVELFFLHIQGSGRLRLPDGKIVRIGYDSQNGHDYVGIGRLLRERGALMPGKATMQDIIEYLNADPVRGAAVMRENPSYIFFRELTGPGPLGALNLPITTRASVAADPKFIPLGAPVFLAMDRTEPNGLWIAQDTGGAIKGPNRVDTFWGEGPEARTLAGTMAARGSALILLPKASAERLLAPR